MSSSRRAAGRGGRASWSRTAPVVLPPGVRVNRAPAENDSAGPGRDPRRRMYPMQTADMHEVRVGEPTGSWDVHRQLVDGRCVDLSTFLTLRYVRWGTGLALRHAPANIGLEKAAVREQSAPPAPPRRRGRVSSAASEGRLIAGWVEHPEPDAECSLRYWISCGVARRRPGT